MTGDSRGCVDSRYLTGACVMLLGVAGLAHAGDADSFMQALKQTQPLVDLRLRYEGVQQTGIVDSANAQTLRARLGGQTGLFLGTRLLVEGEGMFRLDRDYRPDNAVATYTQYPVVADPENHVLNRLMLTNTSLPQTAVTLGRQVIALDDQRFVGSTAWRQNEVTYDAVRLLNRSIPDLAIDLTMLDKVHRPYGVDSPQGTYTGDSYLANIAYQLPFGQLTGFAYLLDFDPMTRLTGALDPRRGSTSTFGGRFTGSWPATPVKLGYNFSYAWQKPRGDNPFSFSNDYLSADLSAGLGGFTLDGGDENMHGNGTIGFATPLATTHLFDGWADKFLTTPADGLNNRHLGLSWDGSHLAGLDKLSATIVYRAFAAQRIDVNYGHEYDLSLSGKLHHYAGLLAYSDYVASPSTPVAVARDTTKFWAQIEYVW